MLDPQLRVLFDGRPKLQFTRGEDRSVLVSVSDAVTQQPIDLTGATAWVEMPTLDGGVLRRSTAPIQLSCTITSAPGVPTLYTYASHGFADNDTVTITAGQASTLPQALSAGTPYLINRIDNSSFTLQNGDTTDVSVNLAGNGYMDISVVAALQISTAICGQMTMLLLNSATRSVPSALAQTAQVVFSIGGRCRIILAQNLLDVYENLEDGT